jgi:hypothetical protein
MIALESKFKRKHGEINNVILNCRNDDTATFPLPGEDPRQCLAITMKKFKAARTLMNSNENISLDDDHSNDGNVHPSMILPTKATSASTSSNTPSTDIATPNRPPRPPVAAVVTGDAKSIIEKQLRFCNMVKVATVDSYSKTEKEAVFMSRHEGELIRSEIRNSTHCLSFPEMYTTDQQEQLLECTRGLLTVQCSKDRLERKKFVHGAVMYVQATNQANQLMTSDVSDDMVWFLERYRSITKESALQARFLGWQDEKEALAVYREAKAESERSLPV